MRRRELILAAGACGALASARTWAQAARMRRIDVILYSPLKDFGPAVVEFRARLAKLGWSEGKNLEMEIRSVEGRVDSFATQVRRAVARNAEVIVVQSTPGALAGKELAAGLPIVFTQVSDPVGSGVVASLARPGGHVTGTSLQILETAGKQIELLKALVPKLERVAWLHNPALGKIDVDASGRYASAAARLGVPLMSLAVDKAADIEPAFAAAARERIQGMVIVASPIYVSERERILRLARQYRIATVFTQSSSVAAGGLASYGPDFVDSFARAASYVDRILRGAKPGDLPVEQSDRFELAINRKAATELGLTIPQSVLLQATEVIE